MNDAKLREINAKVIADMKEDSACNITMSLPDFRLEFARRLLAAAAAEAVPVAWKFSFRNLSGDELTWTTNDENEARGCSEHFNIVPLYAHPQPAPDVAALVEALRYLLSDSQHRHHNCTDEDCPVTLAHDALAAYEKGKK